MDRHAEPARGDLLDRRTPQVAVFIRRVARGVLSPLARVRAGAEPVHRDRERLVGLAAQRSEAHRAGGEALDDLPRRLDLLERHRVAGRPQLHQAAKQPLLGRVAVGQSGEVLVGLPRVPVLASDRMLELGDRVGIPYVQLAVAPPLQDSADREQVPRRARVRAEVTLHRLGREDVQPDAPDPRRRAREVLVDQRRLEPNRLEDLGAAVGLDGRDPHLRDRLQQALAHRPHDSLFGLVAVEVLG